MAAPSPARRAALKVISRVREQQSYAHETLDAVLRAGSLSERDTAFATRLAYGTVATRGTLDEAVAHRLDRVGSLEPRISDALALTAHELLFMRTPARAAVAEGVELVRTIRPQAAGLANAVLRRLAEEAPAFPWGDADTDDAALARLHGFPRWICDLWIAELGREKAAAVMAACNEPAPLYLAHLPFLGDFDEAMRDLAAAGAEPTACEPPGCIVVRRPAAALRAPAFERGLVTAMDAGAQFAVRAVRARAGQCVAEIGAGRGGKSLLVAADARSHGGRADVLAIDLHRFKLDAAAAMASRLGADEVRTLEADATALGTAPGAPKPGSLDAVLVDAPCSGLGTLRRHPDRRWKARRAEIEALAGLGRALLDQAASLVKPGGFVVYSTCTITRPENESVVEGFLSSDAGASFSSEHLGQEVGAPWAEFVTPAGHFRSTPALGGPDGHFVARLRRD